MYRSQKRLLLLLLALTALLIVAAFLYMLGMGRLEGQPRGFWESLEWAAETLSTTGYGSDASWHHPAMVIFVVLLQFAGVLVVFLIFPVYLIPFLEERFETRLPRQSENFSNHVIIFHHGPAVASLIEELARSDVKTLLVVEDQAEARRLLESGHHVVYGSLEEGVLARTQLDKARALIVNSTDDRNAVTILGARQLGFSGEILALVEHPLHRTPMILAGATAAYTPRHVLGAALAARASRRVSPTVAGIQQLGHKLQVSEVRISRNSALQGRTLADAVLGKHIGVTVIGHWTNGRLVSPPVVDAPLEQGGILILVGSPENIQKFTDLCTGAKQLRGHGPFLVAGNGEVGQKVVELLADAGEEIRLIDINPGEGVELVGNVLDPRILEAADVHHVQAVILALNTDTATLFATVIVKDLAPDVPVIARVNQAENVEKIYAAGADFALSISHVSGQLLAWRLLGKEAIAVDPELRVMEVSAHGIEGLHPGDANIRDTTGCSVVAVERDGNLLVEFEPDFSLQARDAVYICGSDEAIHTYGKVFSRD